MILGALLASAAQGIAKLPRAIAGLAGAGGLLMILYSGISQSNPLKFPGTAALMPTIGALLIILAGTSRTLTLPSKIIATKPLQQLGKISYSLYLWHWPVLVIPQVISGTHLRILERIALALLSILLAAITEKYVERPFRRGFVISLKPLRNIAIAGVIASLIAVLAFGADYVSTSELRGKGSTESAADERNFIDSLTIKQTPLNAAPVRPATVDFPVPANLQPSLLNAIQDRPITYADHCHTQENLKPSTKPCIYGDTTSDITVALFGDSHALSWFPALNQVAKEKHWKLLSLTMSACTPADIPAYNRSTASLMNNCPIWRQASIQRIIHAHPFLILVAGTSGFATAINGVEIKGAQRTAIYTAGMNRTIAKLQTSGAQVVMMSDTPAQAQDPLVCLSAHPKSTLACATPAATAISSDWIAVERQIAKKNGISLIEPQLWVCPTDPCPVVIGNLLTYFDTGHMTATFSQALAGRLKTALDAAISANA